MGARKQKHPALLHRGPCVQLAAADTTASEGEQQDTTKPRWLEVAYTGHFKGHWMGEFEFTRKTFEQIVANLQRHPAYVAGADQLPAEEVVSRKLGVAQFDFHHASEMPPTEGDIAVSGAPAQGWVLDAKIADGDGGKAHLWVYAYFMEPAATYIANNQYKWVSVAVDFNGPDPVSGEPVGAVLTSIALTNHPFLQELPPIAASRLALGGYYYGDAAMTPEEAFEAIRRCLGLPETADAALVAGEVVKLKAWTVNGQKPPAGVDPEESLAKFRAILSLPILSTEEEVFNELDKLFARMLGTTNSPAEGTMAAQRQETHPMTTNATQPAGDLRAMLSAQIARRLKKNPDEITDAQILCQVESGMDDSEGLAGLLEAIDAKSVAAGLASIKKLYELKAKLDEMLPKYEAAQAKIDEFETAETEQDVDMAMASHGLDPKDPAKANLRRTLTKERKTNKVEFRKEYGITDESMRQHEAARAHLTQSIATKRETGNKGAVGPLGTLEVSGGRVVASSDSRAQKPLHGDGLENAESADITDLPGANIYQKAEHFVATQLSTPVAYDELHKAAVALVRSQKVHIRAA